MTTREAARPLRRYMRARVRAASLAPTYTITRDVTLAAHETGPGLSFAAWSRAGESRPGMPPPEPYGISYSDWVADDGSEDRDGTDASAIEVATNASSNGQPAPPGKARPEGCPSPLCSQLFRVAQRVNALQYGRWAGGGHLGGATN